MPAGELREQVAFDTPRAAKDVPGGVAADTWDEAFKRSARIRPLTGSEPVIAQRLTGVQPVVVTVRYDSQTKTVTPAWRLRDVRSGKAYNIRTVTIGEHRDYIDLLCESGVAQ
jgi:SPP1 family predicted phage head-tail adaptor